MWKLSLNLFLITASASLTAADEDLTCKKSFHEICGTSEVLTSVTQGKCDETTFCDDYSDETSCRFYCEKRLTLNLEGFSSIAPNTFRSTNFKELTLTQNKSDQKTIKLSPESFNGLSSVKILSLDSIKFTAEGHPFKDLNSVHRLYMSRSELPPDFFPNLWTLSISQVNIPTITPNLTSQISQELKNLYLISINLTGIEEKSFGKFDKLLRLIITDNQLTDLHPGMFGGLNRLFRLDLSNNGITVLRKKTFGELPKLSELNLSHNRIREFDAECFSDLPIDHLSLSHNELEILPVEALRNIKNLRFLMLSHNNISVLPSDLFKGMNISELYLDLSYNNIHDIEPNTFSAFQFSTIKMQYNKLSVLEQETFNSVSIEFLNLSHNNISEIKENAFRHSWVKKVSFFGNPVSNKNRGRWGVDEKHIFGIDVEIPKPKYSIGNKFV